MTNKTISALSSASTIVGTEVLPIVQSSATVKVSVANLTSGLGTIIATKGGTGQTSYAVGDLLYADTTTTLAKLPDVATGNALISGGVSTAPSWGKIGLTTHVSGVLPVANGGTNASSASITAFNNITGYTASGATGTTSTNLVFSTSPALTTPSITGNATLSTGNLSVSTSGKGITTGSAIPLGFGTNSSTTQATLFSSGGFSIGNTTDPGATNLSVTGVTTNAGNFIKSGSNVTAKTTVEYASISVSTSATNIAGGSANGALTIVTGYSGGNQFTDLIFWAYGTASVLNSKNYGGSPAARTYSITDYDLKLAMASGTYTITTAQFQVIAI